MALELLHEEVKPLGQKISWIKMQSFEDLFDDLAQSVHTFGEDVEVTRNLKELGSIVHRDFESCKKVTRRIGSDFGVMDSFNTSAYMALWIFILADIIRIFVTRFPCPTEWL